MKQCDRTWKRSNFSTSGYQHNYSEEIEKLHIHDCPHCHSHHVYLVQVSRILTNTTNTTIKKKLHNRTNLIRFFCCPEAKSRFRGMLTLFHSSEEIIQNIEVVGLRKKSKTAS
ncbi:MAG: hypothetical protein ISR55_13385 [Bacteroidetes bacterium]|nr:hypothetical protein [Bacteroidota bacterium]MBL6964809.1 hypothetical protein [Bacteroidota bacterium]